MSEFNDIVPRQHMVDGFRVTHRAYAGSPSVMYGNYAAYTASMAWPLLAMAIQFVDEINPAAGMAHVALSDHNLSDKTLQYLIDDYIPANRAERLRHEPNVSDADIESLIAFLRWLLTVPEDIRTAMEDDE